jgi:2-(1,2-epoxy-1,2-dihydrophenyl)acetyl-CoA isomerase
VGLVPDSGGVWFLAKMVGAARAWRLAATGEPVSAQQALEWGLFDQVAPLEDFESTWRSFATDLAAGPTRAFALTKQLVAHATEHTLDAQLEREVDAQALAGATNDHLEGVQAFLGKREPKFEGR